MSPRSLQFRGVAAVLALAALMGCSSCPPFRASWYLDPDTPKGKAPGIYLALLNEGTRSAHLSQVIVNPQGGTTLPFSQFVLNPAENATGYMVLLPPKADASKSSPGQDSSAQSSARREAQRIAAQEESDQRYLRSEAKLAEQEWLPGQLLVFRVRDPQQNQCSLPVAVQIQCRDRCARMQPVSGALPNYLDDTWIANCNAVRKAE